MPAQVFSKTTSKYPDCEIAPNALLRSVQYAISAPYSALMQVAKKSLNGEPVFDGVDLVAQPGQGGFTDIYGIHFKSFDVANPTTVLCKAFFGDDPVPTGDLSSATVFGTTGGTSGGTSITRVTVLPAAPTDGQMVVLDLNATYPGVEWLCIYNTSTGWWDVIGGSPISIDTSGIAANIVDGAYHAMPGMSFPVPNQGDYQTKAQGWWGNGAAVTVMLLSLGIGGVIGSNHSEMAVPASEGLTVGFQVKTSNTPAGTVLQPYYLASGAAIANGYNHFEIMPTRIK